MAMEQSEGYVSDKSISLNTVPIFLKQSVARVFADEQSTSGDELFAQAEIDVISTKVHCFCDCGRITLTLFADLCAC